MPNLKVHYRRVELTHDGYCSETGEDDLIEKYYDSDDESIIRTEIYSDDSIPEEQFNSDGTLKSKYWYNYVPWNKNEVMEDMSAGHCCCPPIGIIFKIFKVEKVPDSEFLN